MIQTLISGLPLPTAEWVSAISTAIMALAILITLCFASKQVRFARRQIEEARSVSNGRASFEHILRQTHDKDLIEIFDNFSRIRAKYFSSSEFLDYSTIIFEETKMRDVVDGNPSLGLAYQSLRTDRDYVVHLLNYYEATAIGIQENALDEGIIMEWWRSSYVQDWKELQHFTRGYRTDKGQPAAFRCYQKLAERWATKQESHEIKDSAERYERLTGHTWLREVY